MCLILADDAMLTFALSGPLSALLSDCPDRPGGGDCSAMEDHAWAAVLAWLEAGAGCGECSAAGTVKSAELQDFLASRKAARGAT